MLIFVAMLSLRKIALGALAALSLLACQKDVLPYGNTVGNPAVERDVSPGLGYQKVMILYSEGYNDLTGSLSDNITQLCQGEIPSMNQRNVVVVYSHSALRRADYTTDTEPVLYRLYLRGGKAVRDTLKRFDAGANTMTPDFMRSVLESVRQLFPAHSYGLVYTSHGNGWIPSGYEGEGSYMNVAPSWIGAQFDGSSGNRLSLDIDQLAKAIPFHLEYIAFDACLMGGVEVVYELKDVCDYIIASPTEVMSYGFNYPTMCSHLLCDGPSDLQGVCEDYYQLYVQNNECATIGLYDCSKIRNVAQLCKGIFQAHKGEVFSVRADNVQSYNYSFDYNYDFKDYCRALKASEAELEELEKALSELVIYKNSTPYFIYTKIDPERFSGIGCYIPTKNRPTLNDYYSQTAWNKATGLLD